MVWRFSGPVIEYSKRSKTGLWEEKDLSGGLSNFSYEDFDIKDKQKDSFLELGGVYVPVCSNS